VKLVMTLLARNEADIVDAQIAYHLNAGVDFVIATDNLSEDATTEVLESYARDGYLRLIREPGEELRQAEWVTRMARTAATEYGADWVLNTDADEFWWPRGESLTAILSEVPERFGTVRALLRNFVPRPAGDEPFWERMTVRETPTEAGRLSPLRVQDKVAHRAHPDVAVVMGNHDVSWDGLVDLRGWYPIEILHFALRSPEQCVRKLEYWFKYWEAQGPERGLQPGFDALREGRVDEYYASLAVDDNSLAQGLADDSLAVDVRLRDVLRTLRKAGHAPFRDYLLPVEGAPSLDVPFPTVEEQAEYAAEITVGSERDSVVRTERRLDEAGRRLADLERGVWPRVADRSRAARARRSVARTGQRR
jgi:3',5'-cyclic AMP phosphodiesterase CpdA